MTANAIDIWCNITIEEHLKQYANSAIQETAELIGRESLFEEASYGLEELISRMDRAGVEIAFLPSNQFGGRDHEMESVNIPPEAIYEACHLHPDRFRGVFGINPLQGMEGVMELERAVEEYDFIGAMVLPYGFGIPLNHRKLYPFYSKCAELGIPVLTQVGHTAVRMKNEYGHPRHLEDVALDFPELSIVATNIGWPWTEEVIAQTWTYSNVYLGTTGHAPHYWEEDLVNFIRTRGTDKVLWGTNHPLIDIERSREQIEELNLTEPVKQKLVKENAQAVFDL